MEREILEVRIDFGDGDFGEGEAAPLEGFDGISQAAVRSALDAYGAVLARASARSTMASAMPCASSKYW